MNAKDIMVLVVALRKLTKITKIAPFAYTMLFLIGILSQTFLSYEASLWVDALLYVSPIYTLFPILLSYPLGLCNWYRLQCALPILPTLTGLFDSCICDLTHCAAIINYTIIIIIFALSLVNTYFVFIKK